MLKSKIKSILGSANTAKVKRCYICAKSFGKKKIITNVKYRIFSLPQRHVFFGYYDLQQFNNTEDKILVQSVIHNALVGKDKAEIGYFDITNESYHSLCETNVWSWQQGARLRWHPILHNKILFNDAENGQYVCRLYDIEKHTIEKTYNSAFYDIDRNFTFGLSLDFSRLQRLRPGYGYSNLPEEKNDIAIEKYDLNSGRKTTLVQLPDLRKEIKDEEKYEHYINHISICPDGSKFIFFHLLSPKDGGHWITRLMLYDIMKNDYKTIEEKFIVSHYCWKDNDHLLVTCCDKENHEFYSLYSLLDMRVIPFGRGKLQRDGHPTFVDSRIVSDTYPDKNGFQTLFLCSENGKKEEIARIFHNPFMTGEKRCDLHPRLSLSHKYVCVDNTSSGIRSCCLFELNSVTR